MPKYEVRVHLPQDSVNGFFVALQDAHPLLGNDPRYYNNNQSSKIRSVKPKNTRCYKKFYMSDFGICEKVDLGIQSNKAGKIFLRSETDAIATSEMSNPLKDPLIVIYCKSMKRYFLKDGFHRLFECARRGYLGVVYTLVFFGEVNDCPSTTFPCIAVKHIDYENEIL